MKQHFDIAAEMIKIAQSAEHLKSIEKLAFSREGKEEVSEVEEEMKKLAQEKCKCGDDCDGDCGCECHEEHEKKEASTSLEDTAGLLLEISNELEDQGMDRLAAATIVLADNILKTAASKKSKKKSKKLTMKERIKKMQEARKKGKSKKEESKSVSESSSSEDASKSENKS